MSSIEINKSKCTLCYACVRVCPVKAIEVKINQDFAKIIPSRCIACGSCLQICPERAISYPDSKNSVKNLLNSNSRVVAIAAPSISGEFEDITDYRKFVKMIKALGFEYVNEASFGVDLISLRYADLLKNFKGKYYITSNCPVVVSFVEKYYPELIENLAPILTPMAASAEVIKNLYGEDVKIVYIGPCVAAKFEANEAESKVDAVLTFTELREMFEEFNIKEGMVEYSEFDEPFGNKGSLYPVSNGFLQAVEMDENLLSSNIITTEGRNNVMDALKTFEKKTEFIKNHFNLFYCEGCLMGPGTSPSGDKFLRRTLVVEYAKKRLRNFDFETWQNYIEKFDSYNFSRTFKSNDQRLLQPTNEKIEEILTVIGKDLHHRGFGCASCGYDSCEHFAVAVAQGLAKSDMCLSYNMKNKQEYIKTLRVTNQKLAETEAALRESEKIARREQQLAKDSAETVTAMLQKIPAGVVIVDEKLRIIESNRSFIDLLGEDAKLIDEVIPGLVGADLKSLLSPQFFNLFSYVMKTGEDVMNRDVHQEEALLNVSIFTIRRNKVIGAIIRDMFSPEVRKEEVIKRVGEVIDENLLLVQQIGFLLGEGAAKTEKMLNSIVESYKTDK